MTVYGFVKKDFMLDCLADLRFSFVFRDIVRQHSGKFEEITQQTV